MKVNVTIDIFPDDGFDIYFARDEENGSDLEVIAYERNSKAIEPTPVWGTSTDGGLVPSIFGSPNNEKLISYAHHRAKYMHINLLEAGQIVPNQLNAIINIYEDRALKKRIALGMKPHRVLQVKT